MLKPLALALAAVLALPATAALADDALRTHAEATAYAETGRYAEVQRLCAGYARAHPGAVRCITWGTSVLGRPLVALVASRTGALTPEATARGGWPVLLVQGGIHAGEIDGKDAGFEALRTLLADRSAGAALRRQVLVFVPVFNVDGHERFGAWMRPNQRGPQEMGWRVTAQNLNLNRDYAKADAPEMQAMLRLVQRWDPLAVLDLHVTDGAQFEHEMSVQVEPGYAGDAALRPHGRALRDGVLAALRASGARPLPFYMAFEESDNPASGFADGVSPPRFSTGYFWLRNRLAMLVEAHSWRPYAQRVALTRTAVLASAALMAEQGRTWRTDALAADARAAALAGQPVALAYAATPTPREIAFDGYAYTRTPSEVSGALMTRYDETQPETWHVPLRDEVLPALTLTAPRGGYVVSPAVADAVAAKLSQHGVRFERLRAGWGETPLATFRADRVARAADTSEGRTRLTLAGTWQPERRHVAAGALWVPINQPLARLVMHLLEPQAPDSLSAWGHFLAFYEQKEYMEPYVAEAVAREMLKEPAVRETFEAKLRDDPAFAASPAERLAFFYRRHPSWDEQLGLYPVWRLEQAPPAISPVGKALRARPAPRAAR